MQPEKNDLVTLSQLARRLRVPAIWLRAQADSGALPHVKAGHQRLFNAGVVERLLAERAARGDKMEGEG